MPNAPPAAQATALGAGVGLKPQHYDDAVQCAESGIWFEVHPENYLVDGGPRLALLEAVRAAHPLSLHGVSLSLGGHEPLDEVHLCQLRTLVRRFEPALVSEHLAWSRLDGVYFPDLLPVVRSRAALDRLAAHVDHAQNVLQRTIAVENPSHYLTTLEHAEAWPEPDFLAELARRTGCKLLLDVNNVFISASNLGFSAQAYLVAFAGDAVAEIHLAGHTVDPQLGQQLLIDSHDAAIDAQVWALYERLIARIGPRPTLIERDGNVPAFAELMQERSHAARLLQRTTVSSADVAAPHMTAGNFNVTAA